MSSLPPKGPTPTIEYSHAVRALGCFVIRFLVPMLTIATAAAALPTVDVPCSSEVLFHRGKRTITVRVRQTDVGVLMPVRLVPHPEPLWFLFDSGAARTVLARAVAARLGLKPSSTGTISGVGAGVTPVEIVNDITLLLPDLELRHIALRLATISTGTVDNNRLDGIIGFDLLCRSVVTVDHPRKLMVITKPDAFAIPERGDVLPLEIRGGWSFVKGTLKVPGNAPVTDEFLVDTGSQDAVNHPIIRNSSGPLRQTRTGAGGFGESQTGVVGPNEWFRIGRITIANTESACCAATPEVSRQIGAGILSPFRLTFDYPHKRLILEK